MPVSDWNHVRRYVSSPTAATIFSMVHKPCLAGRLRPSCVRLRSIQTASVHRQNFAAFFQIHPGVLSSRFVLAVTTVPLTVTPALRANYSALTEFYGRAKFFCLKHSPRRGISRMIRPKSNCAILPTLILRVLLPSRR